MVYDARKEYYSKLSKNLKELNREVRNYFRRPLCPQSEEAYFEAADERSSLISRIQSLEAKDPRLKA